MIRKIIKSERGATTVEMAFALPALILCMWVVIQLGLVFRAVSGIQHALGEGAREATLWPTPDDSTITTTISDAVYGIGPGTFDIATPVHNTVAGNVTLEVTYTQETDLLFLPGPTISLSRSKLVWLAE